MARHPYQIGPSHFRIDQRSSGWWVVEDWTQIDGRGQKADEFELTGPFASNEAAEAELARMVNL